MPFARHYAMEKKTMTEYHGKTVKAERKATPSDPGYVEGEDQIVLIFEDDSEMTVRKGEAEASDQPDTPQTGGHA